MRNVKFGRLLIPGAPVTYHWAVCVGGDWYEVAGISKDDKNGPNVINVTRHSHASKAGAGSLGGELVGEVGGGWLDASDVPQHFMAIYITGVLVYLKVETRRLLRNI